MVTYSCYFVCYIGWVFLAVCDLSSWGFLSHSVTFHIARSILDILKWDNRREPLFLVFIFLKEVKNGGNATDSKCMLILNCCGLSAALLAQCVLVWKLCFVNFWTWIWMILTWLILPVVIRLSQRLSHACVSLNKSKLWNCEWLIISVIVYLIVNTTWITVVILELIHA